MICKPCSDLVGLPGKWHPHSRLKTPGPNTASQYSSKPGQLLYSCSNCHTVLLKGRNTGWALAQNPATAAEAPPAKLLETPPEAALLPA